MYFQLALRARPREGACAAASRMEGQGTVCLAAQGRRESRARRRRTRRFSKSSWPRTPGMTTDEFEQIVKDWIATAKHPKFKRPYTEMVYQPMLELLALSAGERLQNLHRFRRRHRVHAPVGGKSLWHPARAGHRQQQQDEVRAARWQAGAGEACRRSISSTTRNGKPVGINKFIGRRPILAFGNSDGDLQMLQWTAAGSGARFMGLRPSHRRRARMGLRPQIVYRPARQGAR